MHRNPRHPRLPNFQASHSARLAKTRLRVRGGSMSLHSEMHVLPKTEGTRRYDFYVVNHISVALLHVGWVRQGQCEQGKPIQLHPLPSLWQRHHSTSSFAFQWASQILSFLIHKRQVFGAVDGEMNLSWNRRDAGTSVQGALWDNGHFLTSRV